VVALIFGDTNGKISCDRGCFEQNGGRRVGNNRRPRVYVYVLLRGLFLARMRQNIEISI
jgi:hypothetical protein